MILEEPEERWDFYLTRIHEHPASIAVDLGLAELAPMRGRPWLVWVRTSMLAPRIDGLANGDEAAALAALEEALAKELKASSGARQVGRLTTRGRRELFFYAESTVELDASMEKIGREHAAYSLQHVARREPEWTAYREVLLPEPEERAWMEERSAIDAARGGAVPEPEPTPEPSD